MYCINVIPAAPLHTSQEARDQERTAGEIALAATLRALSRSRAAAMRNGEVRTQGEDDQAAMVPA